MDVKPLFILIDVIYIPSLAVNESYLVTIYHLSSKHLPENAGHSNNRWIYYYARAMSVNKIQSDMV